jgi:LPS sulfotransferase NodH
MSHRFVVGIGSQRAGSTLLHHLLGAATQAFMHPLKELHYFDTLQGVRSPGALQDFCQRQLLREVDHIVKATEHGFIDDRFRCYLRSCRILGFSDIAQIDYLDLFRPFLRSHALLGEVTPEYMLLDLPSIQAMKQVIGADAAVILVCRDPVDRTLSAVKLMNAYNNLRMDDGQARNWLQGMIDGNTSWIAAQDAYNDYAAAIANYSGEFTHFVAISYEGLVRDPTAAAMRIRDATGLDIDIASFREGLATIANDLGEAFDLGGEIRSLLTARYRQQTRFLEDYFAVQG